MKQAKKGRHTAYYWPMRAGDLGAFSEHLARAAKQSNRLAAGFAAMLEALERVAIAARPVMLTLRGGNHARS